MNQFPPKREKSKGREMHVAKSREVKSIKREEEYNHRESIRI